MTLPKIPLRRITLCLDGRRVPLNREQRLDIQGDVPYWGAGGIMDYVNQALFDEPLVLLGEDGAPFFAPGKDVAYYIEGPSWINNHIHALRPISCNGRFLAYALNTVDYSNYITGSTRDKLTQDDLKQIEVPNPSMEEQRRIADFLDAETARIDQLSSLRRQQISLIEERYSSAISEIVIPGISTSIPRNKMWPWLPARTSVARLGYFAEVQTGITVHGARAATTDDVEVPYLRVANVQGEKIDLTEVKNITVPTDMARRSTLQAGDVVMTEANGNPDNLGRGAVWQGEIPGMVHQNHVFAIRTDQSKLLPAYLSALLASVHGRRYFRFTSTQVGIATTSSSKVMAFPVPLARLDQQQDVVDRCQRTREAIDRAMVSLTDQLELLAERRQALITAAVTGQFDVSSASRRGVTD